jgi:hypothetical protein
VKPVLAAMTQSTRTQELHPEAAGGKDHDDRQPLDSLVAALNRAVARKKAPGMENTERGT